MKKFKHLALLLLATIMVFGCSKYDDTELRNDVNDLQSRVTKLEEWCKTTNGQISALQGLVTALEAKDFVTGVSPIVEGGKDVGFTITFSKSGAISIYNGKDGAKGTDGVAPVIGVAKDTDGHYYWTIKIGDGEATWMKDASGKQIRTTGDKGADGSAGADGEAGADGANGKDGHTPVLSVDTFEGKLYWKVDGVWLEKEGQKVPATGDKGETGETGANGTNGTNGTNGKDGKDGDSIFKKDGIDLTDPDNVTFTLNDKDGTKITLPRTSAMKIFDSFDNFKVAAQNANLTLALNIKDADYKAIKAELTSSAGMTTAIKTRAVATPWEVAITAPTFKADGSVDVQPVVSVTVKDAAEGDIALLKVVVIDGKGVEHASTRVLFYSTKVDVVSVTIDETLDLNVNEEKPLTTSVLPAEAAQTVVWSSSDETVVTVDADGKVKGIKLGSATIKAVSTTDATKFDECTVTVKESPKFENEGEPGIDGSSWEKAYTIKTKEQLVLLATRTNDSDYSNWDSKYYKLVSDIDFGTASTVVWTPIGRFNFKGHFDGGNYTITGKFIAPAASVEYFGIFKKTEDAEIRNLNLAGSMDASAATTLYSSGGIVGYIGDNTSIIHCSNTADLNALKGTVGGIAGSSNSTIIACRNAGNITGSGSGAAGIVAGGAAVIGCVNSGNMLATSTYAGGIVRYNQTCIACWSNAATVIGKYPGAIVGMAGADSNNCYWKEINGVDGAYMGTISNSASFTGNTPTADQIAAMNAAWAVAQPTGREYQFDANGDIVKIP